MCHFYPWESSFLSPSPSLSTFTVTLTYPISTSIFLFTSPSLYLCLFLFILAGPSIALFTFPCLLISRTLSTLIETSHHSYLCMIFPCPCNSCLDRNTPSTSLFCLLSFLYTTFSGRNLDSPSTSQSLTTSSPCNLLCRPSCTPLTNSSESDCPLSNL